MPSKNSLKIYLEGGFYHIYNRGVEKRDIFLEEIDYRVFLKYLKYYLLPKDEVLKEINNNKEKIDFLYLNNFFGKIELLAFCLISNHFHLLIKQNEKLAIEFFMRSLASKYVKYFNKKYQRIGPLFQGVYKAVVIETEEQLCHVSRYIHLNPKDQFKDIRLIKNYQWSSYPAYINNWSVKWLIKDYILNHFRNNLNSYREFVETYQLHDEDKDNLYKELLIDLK